MATVHRGAGAWTVELASLSEEQGLPFVTGDEIVTAFTHIYEKILEA